MLWPIFHEKAKRADLEPAHSYFKAYKEVNKMFASQLLLRLKDNDVLWIHDYHLILLAQELRALGGKQRMGTISRCHRLTSSGRFLSTSN